MLFEKLGQKRDARLSLKAGSSEGWRTGWYAVLAILGAVCIFLIFFVVPVMVGFVSWAKAKATVPYISALLDASPLSFWPIAAEKPGWGAPAALLILLILIAAVLLAIHLRGELERRARLGATNVFGPAASGSNSKGSARTYSDPELISEIDETCSEDEGPTAGSLVIGCMHGKIPDEDRLILAPAESHGIVIGMTGSGKTQTINYPSIWAMANAKEPASAVILDPKGELYASTAPYVRAQGIDALLIDFRNPELSECINPLEAVSRAFFDKKRAYDEEMARALGIAKDAGINPSRMCDDAAWSKAKEGAYLEFRTHIKRAEAQKKSGWSRAEALTRDIALAIVRDADGGGASAGVQHWLDMGRSAIEAVILLVATYTADDYIGGGEPYPEPFPEQRTLPSVLAIFRRYSGDEEDAKKNAKKLVRLFERIDPEHPASKAFAPIRTSQDKEIATTLSEALKFITKLISSDVEAMLTRSDIDFGRLGEERVFLYVVVPTDRPSAGRMFVMLFQQMHQVLVDRAAAFGNRLPVRVNFLLEEFAAVCQGNKVENLPDMLTTGRSYNMRFYITVQTISQLAEIYGEHTLNTILDNCGTKVLIKTSDASGTARFFSQAIGKYTFTAEGESRARNVLALFDKAKTRSTREEERPYFTEDELSRWPQELGALVLQATPGKDPNRSKRARRLGWNGVLYPLIVPTKRAYEISFVARAFALDSAEELERRRKAAREDVKVAFRCPLIPWDPYARSAEEREAIRRQLYAGGISLEARRTIERGRRRDALRAKSRRLLAERLDVDELYARGISYAGALIDELFKECVEREGESSQEAHLMKALWYEDLVNVLDTKAAPAWLEEARLAGVGSDCDGTPTSAGESREAEVTLAEAETPHAGEVPSRPKKNAWIDELRADVRAARSAAGDMAEFARILQLDYRVRIAYRQNGALIYQRIGKPQELTDAKVGKGFTEKELCERFARRARGEAKEA